MEDSFLYTIWAVQISGYIFWSHQRTATFKTFMNDTIRTHLDNFCTVYLDDLLIYFDSEEEHSRHFSSILDKLYAAEFHIISTEYLGYII